MPSDRNEIGMEGVRDGDLHRAVKLFIRVAADDDVIDPYGQPWDTYLVSTSQLEPAVSTITSTVRLVLS